MGTKVSIVPCSDYRQEHVDQAVKESLYLLGGLEQIIKPGQRVLLKVNALLDADQEAAITTHPTIVTAVIKEVKKLGAIPIVGDSPGNGSMSSLKVLEKTGIKAATEQAGGQIISFNEAGLVEVKSPSQNKKIPVLKLAKAVLDADVIINLPKLKTHTWTLYTGAIKNLFGCVTGFNKSKFHATVPQPFDFSQSLVDILEIVKPSLNIMDGVWGMEGQGPSAGKKRLLGIIAASFDAVALDAVCAQAINYQPFDIDAIKIAHERKLGIGELENIEIVGRQLAEIEQKDWQHSAGTYSLTKYLPDFLVALIKPIAQRLLRIDPVIDQAKCKKCLICLKSCPAKTIYNNNGRIEINLSKCIMCYCCHELCPYKAIDLKRSWLAKVLGIGIGS